MMQIQIETSSVVLLIDDGKTVSPDRSEDHEEITGAINSQSDGFWGLCAVKAITPSISLI
jgi:hypothetical protein